MLYLHLFNVLLMYNKNVIRPNKINRWVAHNLEKFNIIFH